MLFVKWKGYDYSFNTWIDEKRQIVDKSIFSQTMQTF